MKYALLFVCLIPACLSAQTTSPFQEGSHGPASLKFIDGVPVAVLQGKPAAMGEQLAALLLTAPDPVPVLKEFLKEVQLENKLPVLKIMASPFKNNIPTHHREEIDGLVKKSGHDLDLLVLVNSLYDLNTSMGCSTFVVEKGRSSTGQPLFGRNFDWLPSKGLPQQSLVVVYRSEGKYAVAAMTLAPITGAITGMNEHGLCVSINAIALKNASDKSEFDWKGVPTLLLVRQVLEECKTIAEAEKFVREARRPTTLCLTLCDPSGGAVFEISPKSVVVRKAKNDITCCTNHFCTELKKGETKCWRLDKLLAEQAKDNKLGVDEIFGHLNTVSQGNRTIQSMVFEPATRTIHLKFGDGSKSATKFPSAKIELNKLIVQK